MILISLGWRKHACPAARIVHLNWEGNEKQISSYWTFWTLKLQVLLPYFISTLHRNRPHVRCWHLAYISVCGWVNNRQSVTSCHRCVRPCFHVLFSTCNYKRLCNYFLAALICGRFVTWPKSSQYRVIFHFLKSFLNTATSHFSFCDGGRISKPSRDNETLFCSL